MSRYNRFYGQYKYYVDEEFGNDDLVDSAKEIIHEQHVSPQNAINIAINHTKEIKENVSEER